MQVPSCFSSIVGSHAKLEPMTRKDDAAVTQLLAAADTKLGIIAGLTIAVASSHKQHGDGGSDDDGNGHSSSASPTASQPTTQQQAEAASDSPRRGKSIAAGKKSGSAVTPGMCSVQEQRDAIRRLQQHNQLLKAELAIEQRDARALLANEKRSQLSELQRTAMSFSRKVALAQRKLTALDLQVQQRQQELEALRQQRLQLHGLGDGSSGSAGSVSASEAGKDAAPASAEPSAASAARRLRALENRLELSLVKKNEIDSVNKHLFGLIDKVRRDRVIFDGIYKKLEREASESRQRHAQSAAELERARAARLEVAREVERVQTQADEEQRDFERQFLDLKCEIETWMRDHGDDSDALMLGSPTSLISTAVSPIVQVSGVSDQGKDLRSPSIVGVNAASIGKKSALTRVAARSTWKIGMERALGNGTDTQVARYEAAFEGIRRVTGIRDTRTLCDELLARDDANFQRFRRVEELSREQVALQAQVAELTAQIDDYKAREGITSSATQKQQLRATQQKLSALVESNQELELEADALQTIFARVKSSVHSVHNLLVHSTGAKTSSNGSGSGSTAGAGGNGSNSTNNGGGGSGGNGSSAGLTSSAGSASSGDSDWLRLGSGGATSLPLSAREVTEANVLEYLRAIETYASRLVLAAAVTDQGESGASATDGGAQSSAATLPSRSAKTASLPLGHGPATLPSDPKQKLQVQVPSLGGVNGVIVLPPHVEPASILMTAAADQLSRSPTKRSILGGQPQNPLSQTQSPPQQQPQLLLHQQRKKGSKFELYSRKSLSQQQFAAALAAAAASSGDGSGVDSSNTALQDRDGEGKAPHQTSQRLSTVEVAADESESQDDDREEKEPGEDEEEERALTYDELRRFAAKNLTTRRRSNN